MTADTEAALNKTLDVLQVVNLYQRQMSEIKEEKYLLEKTKKDLESKIEELEKFNTLVVGRELKMIELKKKIEELENNLSK